MERLQKLRSFNLVAALLLCTAAAAAAAAAAAGAAAVPSAADDFGSQIVQEAVDLNAAHAEDQEPDAKEMESLLHWAIGEAGSLQLLQPTSAACASAYGTYRIAANTQQVHGRRRLSTAGLKEMLRTMHCLHSCISRHSRLDTAGHQHQQHLHLRTARTTVRASPMTWMHPHAGVSVALQQHFSSVVCCLLASLLACLLASLLACCCRAQRSRQAA
jgi:hypothetical protein